MNVTTIQMTAQHLDNDVWQIQMFISDAEGTYEEHPHSPMTIQVRPSYERPASIVGLVCQEISCKLLHR